MNTQIFQNLMKEKLEVIVKNEPQTIKNLVAKEALDYSSESITDFFSDLLQHGCISGMISELIYYVDTHKFYDTHYAEIEELRQNYQGVTGEPLTIKGDLKNFMAWWSFEYIAYNLANELGLEI